ncbi:Syncytin-1 [Nibea albiflora]|uniref:Syncytin-1 n=1 Tax=Nibea albiflora TaxID=240163 RepID=A0ACB7ECS1_NIBAL|nr:Syncytin-1 [Nibea albiflora]
MTKLTKQASPKKCTTLARLFPPIDNNTEGSLSFSPKSANGSYVCFKFNTARCHINHATPPRNITLGKVHPSWCNHTRSGEEIGTWARAGLYYYCGGGTLRTRIIAHSFGTCAMVRLRAPLTLIGRQLTPLGTKMIGKRSHQRPKRKTSFDLSVNSPTYIDAIGVPRGVPNEYKLADQVAAGFENLPIIGALFPVTPNKNVDRINYVHYNVLRLANLTRDAIEGLAEQLGPTSLMAVQNRMALDMLLAEKGGVCAMFGEVCCTYVPNNTAPDGSVTRALDGLRTLSRNMHEDSGLGNPWDDWWTGKFGQWKDLVMSCMISAATFLAIMVTCGCCCIPCIRSLSVRLISTAIEGRPQVVMSLLEVREQENEELAQE